MSATVQLVGNVVSDPDLRFTPSGKAVLNFSVAVNDRRQNPETKQWEDGESAFYRVAVWGESHAVNLSESIAKGMRVLVVGTLKPRSYETKDGTKGLSLDVVASEVAPSLKWATATVSKVRRVEGASGLPTSPPVPDAA